MILRIFFILGLFIFGVIYSYSCALPPDIIHEFRIDTASGGKARVHYTLMSWRNLHGEILADIYSDTKLPVKSGNLDKLSEKFLIQNTKLFINDTNVELRYLTGSIINSTGSDSSASYTPESLIEMEFESDIPSIFLTSTDIRLEFDKQYFQDITPLIHAYIFSDIQRDGKEGSFIIGKDDNQYFQYNLNGYKYAVRNEIKETDTVNTFHLFIEPVVENTMPLMSKPSVYQQVQKTTSGWTSVGTYLESFFYAKPKLYPQLQHPLLVVLG